MPLLSTKGAVSDSYHPPGVGEGPEEHLLAPQLPRCHFLGAAWCQAVCTYPGSAEAAQGQRGRCIHQFQLWKRPKSQVTAWGLATEATRVEPESLSLALTLGLWTG